MLEENTSLPHALTVIENAKGLIREVEAFLPASSNPNFRERFVAEIENPSAGPEFRQKAEKLLGMYEDVFGVSDVVEPDPTNIVNNL